MLDPLTSRLHAWLLDRFRPRPKAGGLQIPANRGSGTEMRSIVNHWRMAASGSLTIRTIAASSRARSRPGRMGLEKRFLRPCTESLTGFPFVLRSQAIGFRDLIPCLILTVLQTQPTPGAKRTQWKNGQ